MSRTARRQRFHGSIAGLGSTSGTRVVLGRWVRSPLGSFADAMVETADGHRVLVAPTPEIAEFVEATYRFDEVRIEPILVRSDGAHWEVRSRSLRLDLETGRRRPVGWLLRAVPRPVAESPMWCALVDPVARTLLRGVRTRGTAGGSRREWYGATDAVAIIAADGCFDDIALGTLAPVDPPCHFGFSSTPRRPSITTVVTTVESCPQ